MVELDSVAKDFGQCLQLPLGFVGSSLRKALLLRALFSRPFVPFSLLIRRLDLPPAFVPSLHLPVGQELDGPIIGATNHAKGL